jgi:hypothetical protein
VLAAPRRLSQRKLERPKAFTDASPKGLWIAKGFSLSKNDAVSGFTKLVPMLAEITSILTILPTLSFVLISSLHGFKDVTRPPD